MAIAVYSRVGRMLDERAISLTDLREELAARYDLHVDARSLDELVRRDPLRRPDIALLEAIAAILRMSVDDLLDVRYLVIVPAGAQVRREAAGTQDVLEETGEEATGELDRGTMPGAARSIVDDDILLGGERDRWLRDLMERRDWGDAPLTDAEREELDTLSRAIARAIIDRDIRDLARRRNISVDQARADVTAAAAKGAAYWSALVADPALMADAVAAARARRRRDQGS